MVKLISPLVGLYILFATSKCIALPLLSDTAEASTTHQSAPVHGILAYDEQPQNSGRVAGFHRDLSSSTQQRQCAPLESKLVKKLGGWKAMNNYADENWSKKERNVVTNDKHYPEVIAEFCAADEPVQISYEGQPDCITNNATTAGVFSGTSGLVSVAVMQGYSASTTFTISSTATLGLSTSFMTMMNFPDITGLMQQFSTSATISNTASKSFMVTQNEMVTTTMLMTAVEGETCDATISVSTCTIQATGKLWLSVTENSTAWFEYKDKVVPHTRPKDDNSAHYKFKYDFKNLDVADRSGFIKFGGPVKVQTRSAYAGTCRNITLAS
ncbi:hypothetical protein DFH05DRAFT_1506822 [Lentinula detonsa]|uniref:Uncharacterized protein n=1 Tax=Lentinula detonsa TaxID=2804962 RepID=A0A9W8NTX4_9AGAR|nr:hypothetical protein DFH05DRAFT_1506822 [Lentinula detonsa]KAJ3980068.1 hypothetical protein F5890DRAFT_788108 [Lentinula detonsa]